MKSRFLSLLVIFIVASSVLAFEAALASPAPAAKTAAEYITEGQALAKGGKIAEAVVLLKEGTAAYPENADLFAYLGLYVGQTAGQQGANYAEAGRLVNESFGYLDKSVALAPESPTGYFYRGVMSVNVPVFLGMLPRGIADLKKVIEIHEKTPASVSPEMLVTAYSMLGAGYEKAENSADARAAYEMVVKIAPGTDAAKSAEARYMALKPAVKKVELKFLEAKADDPEAIASLKKRVQADRTNAPALLDLARAFVDAKRWEEARETLHAYNDLNPSNPEAYRLLYQVVGTLADQGYDPKIETDTTYRTNLAFEAMSAADKMVELAPKDVAARLERGQVAIAMPFFVGKFDQGIDDLEYVLKNTKSAADSARAMYWLGAARERQAMRFWMGVATKFPDTEAAKMSLTAMRPVEANFDPSKHAKPFVSIDFVLGFRDELAPQTAVWIEDANGAHVKTVYVSGFAGNVKGKQVTLPVWAEISKFAGADAVTGASIDVGHHVYAWDCTDASGKPVKPGTYTVKVEVSHWPSMKYQMAETIIDMRKKEASSRVEQGDYIPSLVVTYYPK